MSAKYHIIMPTSGVRDYDKKKFVLYSDKTHTEYRIDIDEVIKLKDDDDVSVSSKVKTYIDIAF